jgi:DNA-binding NarL/FixJ family response regulator
VTPREEQVLGLLRTGWSNREVARELSISPRTVEKHVEALCHKLGTRGRGPLIALAAGLHGG